MIRRRNKYHARKTRVGTRTFASAVEAAYMQELMLREKAGDIRQLEFQPVVWLVGHISYRPDATYLLAGSLEPEWVEVKGVVTDRFRIIKRLWRHSGPGVLLVVRRQGKRGWDVERIVPKGDV